MRFPLMLAGSRNRVLVDSSSDSRHHRLSSASQLRLLGDQDLSILLNPEAAKPDEARLKLSKEDTERV